MIIDRSTIYSFENFKYFTIYRASLLAQMAKRLLTMWETWVQSLAWEDLLEKEMAIHSSILDWKIPWMEGPGRLQSMGSQRVGHTEQLHFHIISLILFHIVYTHTYMYIHIYTLHNSIELVCIIKDFVFINKKSSKGKKIMIS